jgi:hypothetical protein
MVTPRKATGRSAEAEGAFPNTRESLRQLSQMHYRHSHERAGWRAQLDALKLTLERMPTAQIIETDTVDAAKDSEKSFTFLRERCLHLEENLEAERRRSQSLEVEVRNITQRHHVTEAKLSHELHLERCKRRRLSERVDQLIRTLDKHKLQGL